MNGQSGQSGGSAEQPIPQQTAETKPSPLSKPSLADAHKRFQVLVHARNAEERRLGQAESTLTLQEIRAKSTPQLGPDKLADQLALLTVIKSDASGAEEQAQAREYFLEANQGLVITIADQYIKRHPEQRQSLSKEDLIQVGNMGLINALETCSLDMLGARGFGDYAAWRIRGPIIEEGFQQTHLIDIPGNRRTQLNEVIYAQERLVNQLSHEPSVEEIAKELNLDPADVDLRLKDLVLYSVGRYIVGEQHDEAKPSVYTSEPIDPDTDIQHDVEYQTIILSLPEDVSAVLQAHPRWFQALMSRRYDEMKLTEVAEQLGISPERADGLINKALRTLQRSRDFTDTYKDL